MLIGNSRTDCWNVPVLESLVETPSQMIAVADSRGTGTRLCDNDEPDDADFLNPIVFSITAMRWIHRYCHRADSAQDQTDPAVQGVGVYPMSVIATARTSCLQMGMQSGAPWHPSIRTIAGGTGDIQSQIRKKGTGSASFKQAGTPQHGEGG
jgi:hypothetical protein